MYMENVAIKTVLEKGRGEIANNIKKKRKTNMDMDYNNSSQRFRPFGPSVFVLLFSDSHALQTESRLKDRFKEHRRPVHVHKTTR